MNFTYENQGVNTYLVYKVEPGDILDNMSLGMLTNNKIPGLSSTLFTQMNDDKYIKYNISSKVSAKQLFYGTVNRKRLLSVFKGIIDTMLALDDYMIDASSVLLNLDYIFVDPSTYEVNMICLPIANTSESVTLYDFVKNVMFSTQFEQSENCDYVTKTINFLNATPMFSLNGFKQFIYGLVDNENSTVSPPSPARPVTPSVPPLTNINSSISESPAVKPFEHPAPPSTTPVINKEPVVVPPETPTKNISWLYLMQHYNAENAAAYKAQKEAKKQVSNSSKKNNKSKNNKGSITDMGFAIPGQESPISVSTPTSNTEIKMTPQSQPASVTTMSSSASVTKQPVASPVLPIFNGFDDDEGTVVIGVTQQQERQIFPHLIRRKTGERIQINKSVFKIGRNSDLNDYNIQENKFIGHCHCHIITRDSFFYIVDDNTKNHTYVDGQMITGSIEVQISDGCTIRLADEDFEFKLY